MPVSDPDTTGLRKQLRVSLAGGLPLRDQLVEQIKLQIATGQILSGQQLPTVRDMARSLKVNPSTVAKAYSELEHGGIILTRRGGGSFVADRPDERLLVDTREDRLNAILSRAIVEAFSLGYEPDGVEGRFVGLLSQWRQRLLAQRAEKRSFSSRALELSFAGSHDLALEMLLGRLRRAEPRVQVAAKYSGSLAGLIALERGEATLAGTHLLDEESGEYNLPFVRRLLAGIPVVVVTLLERWQGLLVARGNPKGIAGLDALARPDVVFVNRQRGAGTRVLLDYRLRAEGIAPGDVHGYQREVDTHVEVAAAVANGSADVGLGIESAARAAALEFIPLTMERYDLVMQREALDGAWFQPLMQILQADDFRGVVAAMGGYDTSSSGRVVSSATY